MDNTKLDLTKLDLREKLLYFEGGLETTSNEEEKVRKRTKRHSNASFVILVTAIVGHAFFLFYPSLYVGIAKDVFVTYAFFAFVYLIWSIGRSSSKSIDYRDFDTLFRELHSIIDGVYPRDKKVK